MKKSNLSMLFLLLSMALVQASGASPTEDLDSVFRLYEEAASKGDSCGLVQVHLKVADLVARIRKEYLDGKSAAFVKKEYETAGISIEHYSYAIGYDGSILRKAHEIDSNSKCREYTLFSTIRDPDDYPVGTNKAENYLKEFPNGYYAADTHLYIGLFYKDLLAYQEDLKLRPETDSGAEWECYSKFSDDPANAKKVASARQLAIQNLVKALSFHKEFHNYFGIEEAIEDLKSGKGSYGYTLCDC